jgi:voltage-gated potassium channel Kch
MQRSLLLLALAALFVGCKATSKSNVAVTAGGPRFSWEQDAPAPVADPSRVTVLNVRADLTLLELSALEKRDPGSRLQLTKAGQNFVVEVIKADDASAVVAIVAGQTAPELRAGDSLPFAVLAQ